MKQREGTLLLLVFCVGIVGGLLLPRWIWLNIDLKEGWLTADSWRQYPSEAGITFGLLRKILFSRMSLFLLLYFSGYSAAGFWLLSGTFLVIGLTMGFLGAICVIRMGGWGILFWCCALLPQWFLYGWTGKQLAVFMENRRTRVLLCGGNPVSSYSKKLLLSFVQMLVLMLMGVAAEVFLNPWIMYFILNIYTGNR